MDAQSVHLAMPPAKTQINTPYQIYNLFFD